MKKSVSILVFIFAVIFTANSQNIILIDPAVSIDSLLSKCSDVDSRVNEQNFKITESQKYFCEYEFFKFGSEVTKDSIYKKMSEAGFVPANFLEAVIIASTISGLNTFPFISFDASFRSVVTDDYFILSADKSTWGCEFSLSSHYYGKKWKKSHYYLGVRRKFFN